MASVGKLSKILRYPMEVNLESCHPLCQKPCKGNPRGGWNLFMRRSLGFEGSRQGLLEIEIKSYETYPAHGNIVGWISKCGFSLVYTMDKAEPRGRAELATEDWNRTGIWLFLHSFLLFKSMSQHQFLLCNSRMFLIQANSWTPWILNGWSSVPKNRDYPWDIMHSDTKHALFNVRILLLFSPLHYNDRF